MFLNYKTHSMHAHCLVETAENKENKCCHVMIVSLSVNFKLLLRLISQALGQSWLKSHTAQPKECVHSADDPHLASTEASGD